MVKTFFEVFCQKPVIPHGTKLKLCDVVRGYMPLIGMRENMTDFMFTNVSDAQSKNKFEITPTLSPCRKYLYIY